jgi:signal transduction histidine kinase
MRAEVLADSDSGRPAISAPVQRPAVRYVAGVAALALLYYGAAQVGYMLDFAGPVAAIVWLPVGVGVSFLYLGGVRFWPGVLIGDLLANDYATLPIGSALAQTTGNVLEMLAATLLMRRLLRGAPPLGSVRGLGRMLLALAAGTVVSATIGTVALRLGEVVAADQVGHVWRTWWLGDFTGALVVVPLAIAWVRPSRLDGWNGGLIEGTIVLIAVAGLTDLAFSTNAPLTYVVFPALIWAALRFGPRGATAAVAVAVSLTVYDTAHYDGPFRFESITRSVLSTQLYIAVSALSAFCLAAVVAERERFARRLGASRERLVEAGDTARRRLEHDLHDGAQQRLTALMVRLRGAELDSREDPERAAAMFAQASAEVSLAIDELRQLARGLHPAVLTEFGLAAAIRDVAGRSAVPVTLVALPEDRLRETVESTAYFVFAEAVTNAQRSARATVIRVGAAVDASVLRMEITDDGVGGAVESPGSGLEGLRDRVEALGGTFTVDSPPGRGTRVEARIPLSSTGNGNGDGRFGRGRLAAERPPAPT